jgi:hypothetical protein
VRSSHDAVVAAFIDLSLSQRKNNTGIDAAQSKL